MSPAACFLEDEGHADPQVCQSMLCNERIDYGEGGEHMTKWSRRPNSHSLVLFEMIRV